MPRFYNKVELQKSVKVLKTTPMAESQRLLTAKTTASCTNCRLDKPIGVEQKHDSYERRLNQLRFRVQVPY